jgi:hypothetical protein
MAGPKLMAAVGGAIDGRNRHFNCRLRLNWASLSVPHHSTQKKMLLLSAF